MCIRDRFRPPYRKSKKKATSYDNQLLGMIKAKQSEEISEDRNFALSLVPVLSKLNNDQKHFAKVEILNTRRNGKYYTSQPVYQRTSIPFIPAQTPYIQTTQNVNPYTTSRFPQETSSITLLPQLTKTGIMKVPDPSRVFIRVLLSLYCHRVQQVTSDSEIFDMSNN